MYEVACTAQKKTAKLKSAVILHRKIFADPQNYPPKNCGDLQIFCGSAKILRCEIIALLNFALRDS